MTSNPEVLCTSRYHLLMIAAYRGSNCKTWWSACRRSRICTCEKSCGTAHLRLLTENLCGCTYLRQPCLIQKNRKGSFSGPSLFGRAKAICNRVSGQSQEGINSQPGSRKARNNAVLKRQPETVTSLYLPIKCCKALLRNQSYNSGPVQNPAEA